MFTNMKNFQTSPYILITTPVSKSVRVIDMRRAKPVIDMC